jgi:hypothetical protein
MIFTIGKIERLGKLPLKFYIASGFKNKQIVKTLAINIQLAHGWELTYDWTQNDTALTEETLADIGIKEFEAVKNSDVILVVLPGGKGCHTEMGIALGSNKQVILFDPDRTLSNMHNATTFYFLPQIKHWNGEISELNSIIQLAH